MPRGLLEGLQSIREDQEAAERRREARENGRVNWFKLGDGESATVWFLQELDKGSENYLEENGVGVIAVEHSSPKDFKLHALCTAEEGQEGECYACDRHRAGFRTQGDKYDRKWKQTKKLYIFALVEYFDKKGKPRDAENGPQVVLISQTTGAKQITPALLDYATEDGSITDHPFKIARTGAGFNDTSYTLTAKRVKSEDDVVNPADYEVPKLTSVIREVDYEDQPAFYGYGVTDSDVDDADSVEEDEVDVDSSSLADEKW